MSCPRTPRGKVSLVLRGPDGRIKAVRQQFNYLWIGFRCHPGDTVEKFFTTRYSLASSGPIVTSSGKLSCTLSGTLESFRT